MLFYIKRVLFQSTQKHEVSHLTHLRRAQQNFHYALLTSNFETGLIHKHYWTGECYENTILEREFFLMNTSHTERQF
jgi:hypothetical protein